MIAFHALARWRNSAWAVEKGHRLVQTVLDLLTDEGRCNYSRLKTYDSVRFTSDNVSESEHKGKPGAWFDATTSTGRMLEAVIWFHQATGDPLSRELADTLAHHHLRMSTREDGAVRPEILDVNNPGHGHSYLGTLRGLLLYGLLTDNQLFIERVADTYDSGVKTQILRDPGWCPHDLGMSRFPDNENGDPVCESTSTGDLVQLSLWLARATGETRYFDDAERLVRGRIIPAQVKESDISSPEIRPRDIGGWGSIWRPNAEKICIFDVTAAVLHTLTDVQNHIVRETHTELWIDLHFNTEQYGAIVRSERGDDATLTVTTETAREIAIRIPCWVTPESVSMTIDNRPADPKFINHYVHVGAAALKPGSTITVRHDLPSRRSETVMPSGARIEIGWKGDHVTGVSPNEGTRRLYPDL